MHAKISGDGCAIAVVLECEGEDVPFPYGVRTYVLQKEKPKSIIFKSGPFLPGNTSILEGNRLRYRPTRL